MGKFINGVLLGVGISLLVAPKTGKEMRQLVAERLRYLPGIPPENEELKQSVQQTTQRVPEVQQQAAPAVQMGSAAQSSAQQTASSAGSGQEDLGNLAQQANADVPTTRLSARRPIQPNQPNRPTP
jgi:gas vesicle protein